MKETRKLCGLVAAGALAVAGCGNSSPQETGKEYPVCTVSSDIR